MQAHTPVRMRAAAILAGLSLMLAGCFVTPGKFTSELTLLEENKFTFIYEGEVNFLGLATWIKAQQERERSNATFRAYCYGPVGEDAAKAAEEAADEVEAAAEEAVAADEGADDEFDVVVQAASVESIDSGRRDCTPEEEVEQREQWEERQERRRQRERNQAEQIARFTGGIDPTDPEAEAKLAKVLLRQKGFERVEAKGNGLFDVSYKISGTLSHDYMFPMMEDFPTTNPFVQLFLRGGNQVRVNATGFVPVSVSNPIMPYMMAAPGFGGSGDSELEAFKDIPAVEGTFSIVTTGDILANNTDEGPSRASGRNRLTWTIDASSKAPPTALIAMPR